MKPSTLRKSWLVSPPLAAAFAICLTLSAFALPPQARTREQRDPALVQGAQPAQAPKEYPKLPEENVSVTKHTITLGGRPLAYTATAGTIVLKDEDGKSRAKGPSHRLHPRRGQGPGHAAHHLLLQRRPRLVVGLAAPGRLRPRRGRDGSTTAALPGAARPTGRQRHHPGSTSTDLVSSTRWAPATAAPRSRS